MALLINSIYTNEQVREEFGCSLMGGMNKSNRTNTLVLILKHIDNILYWARTSRRSKVIISQ